MVWAPTATINLGNFADNFRSFVDNNLSSMPNWSVATPSGNSSYRNMRYDMGAGNNLGEAGTGQFLYYTYSYIYNTVNGHYNSNASPTWENQEYTGSAGMNMYASTSALKVWTNSSLLDSFLLIDTSGNLVWGWFECQKWFIWGDEAGYPGTTGGLRNTLPLGFALGSGRVAGLPAKDTYSTSAVWLAFDLDCQDNRSFSSLSANFNGKVMQGFRMMTTNGTTSASDKLDTIGIINNDQVLIQMGSQSGGMFSGTPLAKVTDGTNWWLRTNTDIVESGLMFPVGTSEPAFN